MKNPDNGIFLLHIESSLQKILQYLENVTKEEFFSNPLVQDAVVRNYEIIGEATKHISDDLRIKYPDIDWRGMAGLRDILIHHYFGIDLLNVWNISQTLAADILAKIRTLPEFQAAQEKLDKKH